jgi:predicted amidophosphoribosyltransferase
MEIFIYTFFCVYEMVDIFDNTILCKKCDSKMQKAQLAKNGFVFRAVVCPNCREKIIHPIDEEKYSQFMDLKKKEYKVKMRLVGNSYAVSIPKEIVSFMRVHERLIDDMVKLCFEESGRVSLNFHEEEN